METAAGPAPVRPEPARSPLGDRPPYPVAEGPA
jgi:hypothetical protein